MTEDLSWEDQIASAVPFDPAELDPEGRCVVLAVPSGRSGDLEFGGLPAGTTIVLRGMGHGYSHAIVIEEPGDVEWVLERPGDGRITLPPGAAHVRVENKGEDASGMRVELTLTGNHATLNLQPGRYIIRGDHSFALRVDGSTSKKGSAAAPVQVSGDATVREISGRGSVEVKSTLSDDARLAGFVGDAKIEHAPRGMTVSAPNARVTIGSDASFTHPVFAKTFTAHGLLRDSQVRCNEAVIAYKGVEKCRIEVEGSGEKDGTPRIVAGQENPQSKGGWSEPTAVLENPASPPGAPWSLNSGAKVANSLLRAPAGVVAVGDLDGSTVEAATVVVQGKIGLALNGLEDEEGSSASPPGSDDAEIVATESLWVAKSVHGPSGIRLRPGSRAVFRGEVREAAVDGPKAHMLFCGQVQDADVSVKEARFAKACRGSTVKGIVCRFDAALEQSESNTGEVRAFTIHAAEPVRVPVTLISDGEDELPGGFEAPAGFDHVAVKSPARISTSAAGRVKGIAVEADCEIVVGGVEANASQESDAEWVAGSLEFAEPGCRVTVEQRAGKGLRLESVQEATGAFAAEGTVSELHIRGKGKTPRRVGLDDRGPVVLACSRSTLVEVENSAHSEGRNEDSAGGPPRRSHPLTLAPVFRSSGAR